jgi:hypothetical protein
MKNSKMRWSCPTDGCYHDRKVVKFECFDGIFPRDINFTDLDGFVEYQFRFCIQEWKDPEVEEIPRGQEIAFLRFANHGNAVFVVFGDCRDMMVDRFTVFLNGKKYDKSPATLGDLCDEIRRWKLAADVAAEKAAV